MKLCFRALPLLLFFTPVALADNWPGWRGPNGNGISAEKSAPTKWDEKTNVRWKVKLPMAGNSSPVVWGSRVLLTQSLDKKGRQRATICFDRKTGKELWRKVVPFDHDEPTHGTNPHCSATPVTDGERIIVSHGSAGLYCYDMDGNEQWRYDLGKLWHVWGNASSPILYKDLCILWCGPGERQFLLAVDKRTGSRKWQHDEPGGKFGDDSKDWIGSWATPVVVNIKGRDEMILTVPHKVKAFDPNTGKELWSCDGLGRLAYNSPVVSPDGIVIAMSGFHGPALAVKAGGNGDVTKTHRLWHHTKGIPQRIGSPVIVGNHAYLMSTPGIPQCFELETGKEVWKAPRLDAETWGSFVLVGDKLYIADGNGACHVLAASPKFQVLATNHLGPGELVRSSIAVSDGELFIRTYRHLWCISQK